MATDRFNGVLASKAIKVPVRRATNANQTLSGDPGTIDGYTFSDGDRLLCYGQTDPVENGIYDVSLTGDWSRSADFDGARDATTSTLVVAERSVGNPVMWILTNTDPVIIGTDAITFQQYFDPDAPAAADLQAVTDVGNTTDNNILLASDTAELQFGAIPEFGIRFDGDQTLEIYDISNVNTGVRIGPGLNNLFLQPETASNAVMVIGESTTLRGDGANSIINMYGEQGGSIAWGRIYNDGTKMEVSGLTTDLELAGQQLVYTDQTPLRVQESSTDYIELDSGGNIGRIEFGPLNTQLEIGTASNIQKTVFGYAGSIALNQTNAAPADTISQGQIWVRNDDPQSLMFTDDDGTDVVLVANGAIAASPQWDSYKYNYDSSIVQGDPGSGNVRFNSATPNLVQEIFIDPIDADGTDLDADVWNLVVQGQLIRVRDPQTLAIQHTYRVNQVFDFTSYWRFSVDYVRGKTGTWPVNGTPVEILLEYTPDVELGTTAGDVLRWDTGDDRYERSGVVFIDDSVPPSTGAGVITINATATTDSRRPQLWLPAVGTVSVQYTSEHQVNDSGFYLRTRGNVNPATHYWGHYDTLVDTDLFGITENNEFRILAGATFVSEAPGIYGDPGNEGTSILVNGVAYTSTLKISDLGDTNEAQLHYHRHSDTLPCILVASRARGTTSAHVNVADNDDLFTIVASGWHTSTYSISSEIRMSVDGTPGLNDMPGQIAFLTSPDGSQTAVERMRIRSSGNIEMDYPAIIAASVATTDALTISNDQTAYCLALDVDGLNTGGIRVNVNVNNSTPIWRVFDDVGGNGFRLDFDPTVLAADHFLALVSDSTGEVMRYNADGVVEAASDLLIGGALSIAEIAAAPADTLGRGQIWVNSGDADLYFTDELGNDINLTGAGALPSSSVAGSVLIGDGSGGWNDENNVTISAAGDLSLVSDSPAILLNDNNATLDEGNWIVSSNSDLFRIQSAADATPGSAAQTAIAITRTGTAVGSISLLQGGNTRLVTRGTGVVGIQSDDSLDTSNRYIAFEHQDGTDRARVGHFGNDFFQVYNLIHGGGMILVGENGAGALRRHVEIDPDGDFDIWAVGDINLRVAQTAEATGELAISAVANGAVSVYHDGGLRLNTASGGVVELRSDGNTDAENRYLALDHLDGTLRGLVGFNTGLAGDAIEVSNRVPGGEIYMRARNTGDTANNILFRGDPDAQVRLYYAGTEVFATTADGYIVSGKWEVGATQNVAEQNIRLRSGSQLLVNTVDNLTTAFQVNPGAAAANAVAISTNLRFDFNDPIRVVGGGVSATGNTPNTGINETVAFIDVSGGNARFGSYNWNLGAWQPGQVNGSDFEIHARDAGGTISFQTGASERMLIDATNGRIVFNSYPLFIQERAASAADVAGYGQLWVSTTNLLRFTPDGGTDYTLTRLEAAETISGAWDFTNKIDFAASIAGGASIRLPHGVAPTTPVDGDIWTTTASVFARVNGSTVDLGQSGGGIGGTIANDQVAFGAATADEIEGSSNLTFDGTTLTLGAAADMVVQDNAEIQLGTAGADGRIYSNGTNIFIEHKVAAGDILINTAISGLVAIQESGSTKFEVNHGSDRVQINDYTLYIEERGTASGDVAGYGQLWVRNDVPNSLVFTDDAGNDITIASDGNPAGIVDDYNDAGSLTLGTTTFTTALTMTLKANTNYMLSAVFDVQAPSADDIKIRFSGIGTSSSMNGILMESETDTILPIWATTAQSVSNTVVIPTNGGSNGQGLGTYVFIQATVNVGASDITFVLQAAKNADTGADGFIRIYRGMQAIPL